MKLPNNFCKALATALTFLLIVFSQTACKKKGPVPFNPAFAQYISAFTGGSISAVSTIRIRLTDAFAGEVALNTPLTTKLLEFSPSLDGELVWIDNQTLEFKPKEKLKRGEVYEAEFQLGNIVQVPSNLKEFTFSFMVMNQHMQTEIASIKPYRNDELSLMQLSGIVNSRDVCDINELPKTVQASEDGTSLPVSWTHDNDPRIHYFTVDSIKRDQNDHSVSLLWQGKHIDADQSGNIIQTIPALNDFLVFFHKAVQQPEQYLHLQFSDPLDPTQNLDGLIEFSSISYMEGIRFSIEANEVKVFMPYRLTGEHTIIVHQGIKNISGKSNFSEQQLSVFFEELKPEVKIPDPSRVILPSTDGLVFPFEAVNLSAVDVKVVRIFENNVPQFLQVNDLDGNNQLRRVGRVVKKKTVYLNEEQGKSLSQWNTFFLKLDEIIKQEPGAIYKIELSFKKSYNLCNCPDDGDRDEVNMQQTEELISGTDDSDDVVGYNGDYYSDYDYEYYGEYYDDWDYEYGDSNNPCKEAFYQSKEPVSKNILASDLGLIAKQGQDKSIMVVVTDMKTAKPISGVSVQILNYQQEILATLKTDGQGLAAVDKVEGVPYLLVAKHSNQRGYLKVDGGHALSLSTFDTGGEQSQKGLKGYIYGERSVWRPGDSLFVSFILEDEKNVLPEIHPVHFELTNPRGQIVDKMVKSVGINGFFDFSTVTSPDGETGTYFATIRVGGATFSKALRVETIKPNRLKLNLDFGKDQLTSVDKNAQGTLDVKWLHGAVARNMKANVTVNFVSTSTVFEQYESYIFSDPVRSFSSEEQVIFDGYINAEGKATVAMNIDLAARAPGMVNANFSVKVFEDGGDFSSDRFTVPYAPYKNFVGIELPVPKESYALDTDKNHTVQVVTVNAQGKPIACDSLQWNLYKVQWRWWWERSSGDLANFVGGESTTSIAQGLIKSGSNGKSSFAINVPRENWGRFLVRVEDLSGGHATGQSIYLDWPMNEGRATRGNDEGANYLAFTMDKTKYTTGEQCKISFPSSENSRAFVSIENSTGVIKTQWVTTEKDQTSFSFLTDESMAPNAYINITLLQPHNQTINDLPIRLYGVMPLFVENPSSHITPVIRMADELEPEKEFEVKVSEQDGKAMSYTIAIVDDGLLDLTRFKTPDPWNHFYAREALGVNTFDMYDQVIGAFGSKLEKLLSLGGDGETNGKAKNRANRFKPVVLFSGPQTVEKGKTNTHKFKMPNYIGSVRVMIVAGKDLAYGNTEKTVPVKKPLMVLATLPRVLGPGETLNFPVTVFAMDKKIKDVAVKVEANDLLQFISGNTKNISFNELGDQVVNFPIKVADKVGVGKAKVTVSAAGLTSTYDIELDVRNANTFETSIQEVLLDAGKSWKTTFDLKWLQGSNSAFVEVSSLPAIDFGRRLKYLMDYPHGCVEQTTSAAFPQLYLSKVTDLTPGEKSKTEENIKVAISRLASFQTRGGGMSYWPGSFDPDEWGTNYAGHFMIEAQKEGYTLPSGWLNSWLSFQQKLAQNWMPQDSRSGNYYWQENDLMQAYRLYTLALAGKPELGAMNRMKERLYLSTAGKWRLAAAYALAGRVEEANTLIANLPNKVSPYISLSYSYGSNWRDDAMIIETLVLMNQRTKAAPLIKDLATQLSSNNWYGTQTVAYGLIAYSAFAKGETGKKIAYSNTYNGKALGSKTTNLPISKQTLSVTQLLGNSIEINNTGGTMLYVRLITTGQPAAGNESAATSNMSVVVKYFDLSGKTVDVSRIEQGKDFYAEVAVFNPGVRGKLDELALTQVFPSGWEIINNRLDPSAVVGSADTPNYLDIRDDRVCNYFDLSQNSSKRFRVKLNASYTGRFYLPGAACEAMYDNTIFARTIGQWVEVVPAGGAMVMK